MTAKIILITFCLFVLSPLLLGLSVVALVYFFYDRTLTSLEIRKRMNLKYKAHEKNLLYNS